MWPAEVWAVDDSANMLELRMPGGSTREYRGSVSLVKHGNGGRTVNQVKLEDSGHAFTYRFALRSSLFTAS